MRSSQKKEIRNQRIIERRNNKESISDIAQSENISAGRVRNILSNNWSKVTFREDDYNLVPSRKEEIIALYLNGKNSKEIQKEINVSRALVSFHVRNYLKENNQEAPSQSYYAVRKNPENETDHVAFVLLINFGNTKEEIMRALNISKNTYSNIKRKYF